MEAVAEANENAGNSITVPDNVALLATMGAGKRDVFVGHLALLVLKWAVLRCSALFADQFESVWRFWRKLLVKSTIDSD